MLTTAFANARIALKVIIIINNNEKKKKKKKDRQQSASLVAFSDCFRVIHHQRSMLASQKISIASWLATNQATSVLNTCDIF